MLTATVQRSRHAYVLVKPLCESHRVDELLAMPGWSPARALGLPRCRRPGPLRGRQFGDANLRALRAIADGSIGRGWQGSDSTPTPST
ncbi:hypothetical protein NKG94_14900 [Micromonospora sp. M12]